MTGEPKAARLDFEAEGLLEGVKGRGREARLRLLNRLFEAGVGLDQLKEAVAHDRLVILPAEHALGGDARFSARELSDKAGMPLEFFLAVRRAHGLAASDPDEAVYAEKDIDAALVMAEFYEAGFDREGMLEAAGTRPRPGSPCDRRQHSLERCEVGMDVCYCSDPHAMGLTRSSAPEDPGRRPAPRFAADSACR